MHELRKVAGGLQVLQPKLKEAFDQQNTLIASAEQRLKWAAGANPALSEVFLLKSLLLNNFFFIAGI